MRTSELTGPLLDYWVAKAKNYQWRCPWMLEQKGMQEWQQYEQAWGNPTPAYSSDWAFGGPIIECEQIQIGPPTQRIHRSGGPNGGWDASGFWSACTWYNGVGQKRSIGHDKVSPLVAAMRCYVRSKFGEEVPDIKE